jgi:hypothetical protein
VKARKNPTPEQILRRLRRRPESGHDPRYEKDGYWALRLQGFPHSYAKRAFRDEPPNVTEQKVTTGTGCDPEDILFPAGTTFKKVGVSVRPQLTEEIISTLQPRLSEYTVWDDKISGFGLRVRVSGRKSFVLLYRVRGETKLKKITIGRAEGIALAAARDMARELLSEACMGRDPAKRFKAATVSMQGPDEE